MLNRCKKIIYSVILVIGLSTTLLYFQSCEQDFVNTPESEKPVPFPPEIDSVFKTTYGPNNLSCAAAQCHASENDPGGLNLSDWKKTLNGSKNGTMVIPYNGFWSHLISYLNLDTTKAPIIYIDPNSFQYNNHKIDTHSVSKLIKWINEGAKDANGNVAFTNVPNNEKGFITNQSADVVAVIKPNDKQVIRLIPVGGRPSTIDAPHYITLSPDNKFFYVSLIQEGYVEKYDVTTHTQIGRMQAGLNPAHIVISPDGSTGFVTNFDASGTERTVRKFNTETMQVMEQLSDPMMTAPHGMALSNDGQYLYVTSQIGEFIFKMNTNYFSNHDSLISAQIGSLPQGSYKPYQVILSSDNNFLFVSCVASNEVRVYNSSDLTFVRSYPVGKNPLLMKFIKNSNELFVCNRNDSSVTVINTSTHDIRTVHDAGVQPHGVDFTSDGQYAYIACETQLGFDGHHPTVGSTKIGVSRIIRVSDLNLLPDKIEMGSFPAGIAIVK